MLKINHMMVQAFLTNTQKYTIHKCSKVQALDSFRPPFYSTNSNHRANLVTKYRTTVALIGDEQSHNIILESGGMNNLFHSKALFTKCRSIEEESLRAAFGSNHILGKGILQIPIDGGIQVEAYHVPRFTLNILAVNYLARTFDVLFNSVDGNHCFIKELHTGRCSFKTPCEQGLYVISKADDNRNMEAHLSSINEDNIVIKWHNKVGHLSAQRYMKLSKLTDQVPIFNSEMLRKLECLPCLTAKDRKAPVTSVSETSSQSVEEVHVDI